MPHAENTRNIEENESCNVFVFSAISVGVGGAHLVKPKKKTPTLTPENVSLPITES